MTIDELIAKLSKMRGATPVRVDIDDSQKEIVGVITDVTLSGQVVLLVVEPV